MVFIARLICAPLEANMSERKPPDWLLILAEGGRNPLDMLHHVLPPLQGFCIIGRDRLALTDNLGGASPAGFGGGDQRGPA